MNKYFENRALAAEETKWWTTATSEDFWKFADKVQDETLDEARHLFGHLAVANKDTLQRILIQYRFFTVYYIPDLAFIIARLEDGAMSSFLADILNDELGHGDPKNAHPVLYDKFLATIDVDPSDIKAGALKENINLLQEARRQLVSDEYSTEFAIGLRGMGGECVCQVYIAELFAALSKNSIIKQNKNSIDWTFWDLHVGEHDIEHREETRRLIDEEILQKGGVGLQHLGAGYDASITSWKQFWKNIFDLKNIEPASKRLPKLVQVPPMSLSSLVSQRKAT